MFIVLEIQKSSEETLSYLGTVFNTRAEAESKYHAILQYAAISTVLAHSVAIISEEGQTIRNETYYHPVEVEEIMESPVRDPEEIDAEEALREE